MKDYQKYIFDLDYTLLIPDWSRENEYLIKHVPLEEQKDFFEQKQVLLSRYEQEFPKYDLKTLSEFFRTYGFTLSDEVLGGWMIHNGETIKDEVVDGSIELLEYLKTNKKSIVLLTSWFGLTQIPRLKRTGLYNYFDKIVTGDNAMKPDLESFKLAIGDTPNEDCIMIGDSIKSDKFGAENAGIDYYLVDKNHSIRNFYQRILKK